MNFLATLLGKIIAQVLSLTSNGGQALPGLIIERIFPSYVPKMLAKLPDGVILITGTNGKTTTTKIVVQLLRANGKKVLTNPTGSNLTRGVASAISQQSNWLGRLNFDLAVLEIDEATIANLVKVIKPDWLLALNVSRDQLDRYGEIDHVAKRIGEAISATKKGIVVNANDPNLFELVKKANVPVKYFGASSSLNKFFPSDYELAAVDKISKAVDTKKLDVELVNFKNQDVSYKISGKVYSATLKLTGQHNFLNGAAALAIVGNFLPKADKQGLVDELAKVPLAFGRGEAYRLPSGRSVELVLVKNPASFTQALASYQNDNRQLAIFINDNIADGRDVSWLWDVNFQPLAKKTIELAGGSRAADMGLRLNYDGIKVPKIEPSIDKALKSLNSGSQQLVILATYTAMMKLHRGLAK